MTDLQYMKKFKSDLQLKSALDHEKLQLIINIANSFSNNNSEICKDIFIRDYIFLEYADRYKNRFSKNQEITINNIKYKYINSKNNNLAIYFWFFDNKNDVSNIFFTIVIGPTETIFVAMQEHAF